MADFGNDSVILADGMENNKPKEFCSTFIRIEFGAGDFPCPGRFDFESFAR